MTEVASVPTSGATDWEHFSIGRSPDFSIANLVYKFNHNHNSVSDSSKVFKGAQRQQTEAHFLAVSNEGDIQRGRDQISRIYRVEIRYE